MKLCALLFASFLLSLSAQTVTGTIEKVEKDILLVKGPKGSIHLTVDEKTTIHKGKSTHDIAVLAPGDEIRANYYGESAPTAVTISVKVTFKGAITQTSSNHVPGSQRRRRQGEHLRVPPSRRQVRHLAQQDHHRTPCPHRRLGTLATA